MSARRINPLNPVVRSSGQISPRLRPVCQAVALMLAASATVSAQAATNLANLGAQMTAARNAAGASGRVNLGVSPQQAQQQTQVSLQNLSHAAQGIAQQIAAQQAAAAAGLGAASNVPNGLGVGGLQVAPGVSSDPNSTTPWINANLPTQTVDSNGHVDVNVQQTAQKAILTWQTMNVGKQTTLNFDQSGGAQANGLNNWVVLNRIMDPSGAPSQILGNITAQGSVYVINRNGVIFGSGSQVNVNSLIASSLNLFSNDIATSNNRFLTGGIGDLNTTNVATNSILLTTDTPGAGDITIAPGASIALGNQGLGLIAAPDVTNEGIITAPGGQVALIAGIGVSYDYNFTSFAAGDGSKPQGTNDNSTTMLRFANYGKLTDANGNDITPVGTLINDGSIITPRGNITLLGGAIRQDGVAIATTSVAQPGSIVVSSVYEVGVHGGSLTPSDEFDTNFYTGRVTFGPQAVTAILPDNNGVTLPGDATSLAPFQNVPGPAGFTSPLPTQGPGLVEISGQSIDFQGGTLVYAPGQTLSANAVILRDPRASVPVLPDAGRILLESGATLDVSGIPNTELAMASNLLTVTLAGNELADSPLQRNGFLNDASVTVDMGDSGINPETGEPWIGTPLANLASYANLVQHSIGQLLVNGGTIDLSANEVVGEAGSTINLMGGYLHYLAGTVNTTRLVDRNGVLVSIGAADPNDTFVGLAGEFVESHPRWGVTKTWYSPLLNQGVFEGDYIVGGNAGTLNISIEAGNGIFGAPAIADSGAAVLDSTVLAGTVAGSRQVASGALPSDGSFVFSGILPIEIGDPSLLSPSSLAAASLPADFTATSALLAIPGSNYAKANVFNSQALSDDNFGKISLSTGAGSLTDAPPSASQGIVEDAGSVLAVQPGGSITLLGSTVEIDGTLTARAGTISITTVPNNKSFTNGNVPGDIVIGSQAVLDVSGFFVNDRLLAPDEQGASVMVDAGSISLVTDFGTSSDTLPVDLTGNITLTAGSLLDLEGGGEILANGQLRTDSKGVPLGTGGNLTLSTYLGVQMPSPVFGTAQSRGTLTLDGTIDALGFNGGGTVSLQTMALQVGGEATTPSYAFYFDPQKWGDLGFGSFNLSSVLQTEVPAGAIVLLQHENLLPGMAIADAPNGADPAAWSNVGLLSGTWRSPTNLSVNAGLEEASNIGIAASGSDYAQVDAGAQILGDPGASISISSKSMTSILGTIRAPGGSISLAMNAPADNVGPMGPLYLGPVSVLDVAGTTVIDPLAAPVNTRNGLVTPYTGEILAGGTINLTDDASPILVAPGASLNVSGASGAFDITRLTPGGILGGGQLVVSRQDQWSDAGQVNIRGATGLLFEGTLIGNPGAPQAAGGTLSIMGDLLPGSIASNVMLVQNTADAVTAVGTTTGNPVSFDFATYVPTATLALQRIDINIPGGDLVFGADSLNGSGFSNLILDESSGGSVTFAGAVSMNLSNSFVAHAVQYVGTNAGNLVVSGVSGPHLPGGLTPTTNGASLTVTAPYIALDGVNTANNNNTSLPQGSPPGSADASLTLNADQIDLSGMITLRNIGEANFDSTGDIRLLPAQIAPPGTQLVGYLLTAGNLNFSAADLYPATDTAFVIQAVTTSNQTSTTITFATPAGADPSSSTPLSAGGTLLVDATNIVQNGKIQAPFGSIILGVTGDSSTLRGAIGTALGGFNQQVYVQADDTQSVVLGNGSVTSVSGNGMLIPFGQTLDQTTWIYNPQPNNPNWNNGVAQTQYSNPLTGAPQGVVTLNGDAVAFNAGAVININGGGDLQAQEWIPGTGGSRDVLSQFNTSYANSSKGTQVPLYPDARQIFAIVPGYAGKVAPYDAALSQSGLAAGEAIYLAGGPGLPAGTYMLLPAKYATLPGAFRVVVNSGIVNPLTNQTTVLPDGTMQISGYLTDGLSGTRPSSTSQFMVQSAATWGQYSQYAVTSANSFFPSYANQNGLATPYVPIDAGRLVLAATTGLTIDGTLRGDAAPGGSGSQVDISSQFIQIIGNGEAVDPGYLGVSAASIDSLGASSLLIGGTREMTAAGTVITPKANGLVVSTDAGAPLSAPEIMMVAAPQFQSGTIQIDNEGDTATIMTPVAGTGQIVIRDGSVVEATGSIGTESQTRLILGGTLDNLPTLPDSLLSSDAATTAATIANYYQALDASLGTLIQVSNGKPGTVQLPSPAQISPASITVTDNLNPANADYTIVLPSLSGNASGTGAVIESGAQVLGGNTLTLASTGDIQVQPGALLSGTHFSAFSSSITFVGSGSGAAPTSGMAIDSNMLAELEQSETVDLQSYGAIAFQGNVNFQMASPDGQGMLTLGAADLSSDGGQVTISAPTLVLDNELNAPVPGFTAGSGSLNIDVGQLVFGSGTKTLDGFGNLNLVASRAVVGEGTGSMDFGTLPVALHTPTVVADTSSSQTLTTTGALSVLSFTGSVTGSDALGGAITLQGGSVTVSAPIQAQAGNISLEASAGDVVVTGTGSLMAGGVAKQFADVVEYASAGAITLSANQGTVDVEPGAVVDFSGAAMGGNGGALTIHTTNTTAAVQLDGTFLGSTAAGYTGSAFSLDTGGAIVLDSVARMAANAGITGAITVDAAQGDLNLSQREHLTASQVVLVADGGAIDVAGVIDASGAAGGTIELYGTRGVTLDGSLLARGSDPQQLGGTIDIGTSGNFDLATGTYNTAYGYENIAAANAGTITIGSNALIDVSGGTVGGLSGGTVLLRAPLLEDGSVNVVLSPTASFVGARRVTLERYAIWSTADGTTGGQHFDGVVDPAGWFDSTGTLLGGTFTDVNGNPLATWSGGVLTHSDGTTHDLNYYLSNDYFTPDAANAAHETFYGYANGDATAAVPGTLMGFVESPGFVPVANASGIANFQDTPGIELDNPVSAGVNNGDIQVLTNWNLGAVGADSNLLYRYNGMAPYLTFRAGRNVAIKASITDGFVQAAGLGRVTPPPPPVGPFPFLTDSGDLVDYNQISGGDNVNFFNFGDLPFDAPSLSVAPPASFGALGLSGANVSDGYYGAYELYLSTYADFYTNYLGGATGFYGNSGITATPDVAAAYAAAQSSYSATNLSAYSGYVANYQTYLAVWWNWVLTSFGNGFVVFATLPIAPSLPPAVSLPVPPPPPPPVLPAANAPSPIANPNNLAPIAGMNLAPEASSTSYRFVAGANLQSADPLALGAVGSGNVVIDGHTDFGVSTTSTQVIAVPTIVRTGTGSIDIAAAGDFTLLDPLAPGVVYTAGTPVQSPVGGDVISLALGDGAFHSAFNSANGVSTVLTSETNPEDGGNITLTALGNVIGIENVSDTLANTASGAAGVSGIAGTFLGQFWSPWLLTNPAVPDIPWYVNFGSFDQGIMSLGGNVTVRAGGDIHDLAVSVPTTAYLDNANALHVTGGGNLSVTADGDIYSGDFYVGQGVGTIKAGGAIGSDFTYGSPAFPVQTLLAVQYGTISVEARQSADIGGVYDPTYLWTSGIFTGRTTQPPVASYATASAIPVDLMPYVTSMGTDSGVSITSTSGSVTFNSLLVQAGLFSLGASLGIVGNDITDLSAGISSLLLPASLSLVAIDGSVTVDHGGGLYPSATGTLSIVADQSIHLEAALLPPDTSSGIAISIPPVYAKLGNVYGFSLGKLDYPVGTGILPTASNPELVDVSQLPATQIHDSSLIQDSAAAPVKIIALNGSIIDGVPLTPELGSIVTPQYDAFGDLLPRSLAVSLGGTVEQISLIAGAPAEVYAGQDILDLPFFGENFTATDITSLTAGRDIRTNIFGDGQSAAIELAGPGALLIQAGRNIDFGSQRAIGASETGIRTIGNSIDDAAKPMYASGPSSGLTFLGDFGNPYLPDGGASVSVLFGVGPGMDQPAFINQYVNPANASAALPASLALLMSFVDQYETASGHAAGAPRTAAQAWEVFQTMPALQQQLLVEQVFDEVLNTTGTDYNNPASPFFHQYSRGYQAVNVLFPASLGYTANSLDSSNGANQTVASGNLDMRGSTIQSQQGGDISIFGPGGRILVGSSVASPAVDPASEGILTLEKGNIDTFTDADVLVAQSRVMTEQGGNVLMWSSNGNLDAGKGAKTSVSAPPPLYACDIDFICSVDIKGVVSGAGIATLQSLPDVPIGDANLIAPRGTVDAGAAGIRVSGNLNVAALHVANVDNIQVQGKTTGIPVVAAVDTGALTAASTATSAVTQMAQNLVRTNASGVPQRHWIITVQVEGFGDSNDDSGGSDARKKRKPLPAAYNPSEAVVVLGFGGVGPTQRAYLTKEEQNKAAGI